MDKFLSGCKRAVEDNKALTSVQTNNFSSRNNMKTNKLKTFWNASCMLTNHEFFKLKLKSYEKQKSFLKKQPVNEKALLASYKILYKIAKCKKLHTIGEELNFPASIEIVQTMFGDNFTKQLQCIPLSNDTVGSRIGDNAEDIQ